MKDIKKIIGKTIRHHREQKKLTQQQLADKLGVNRQYVYKVETGKVNMSFDYLDKIIGALECDPNDFFNEIFYYNN